jgi:hypothetical protein
MQARAAGTAGPAQALVASVAVAVVLVVFPVVVVVVVVLVPVVVIVVQVLVFFFPATPNSSRAFLRASSTVLPVNSWYSLIDVSLAGGFFAVPV